MNHVTQKAIVKVCAVAAIFVANFSELSFVLAVTLMRYFINEFIRG